MKNEQDIRIPEGLNQRLSSLIDELDAQERKRKSIRLRWWSTVSVAACVALAIGIGTHTHSQDEKLIEAVNYDICKSDFHCEPYYPMPKNTLELARVFAYACCTTESKDNFTAIKDYVFCDDIYEALKKAEISAGKIIQLIRNWCTGEKKEKVLKMFEEYGADEKMIDVYRELYNQWNAASCLARVNALIMLKYFENK